MLLSKVRFLGHSVRYVIIKLLESIYEDIKEKIYSYNVLDSAHFELLIIDDSYIAYILILVKMQWPFVFFIRPDQFNKLLHGFARSNFWANRKKKN